MMVTVVITICSMASDACMQIAPFDPVPAQTCWMGEPALAKWTAENRPGYRLAKWKCVPGTPAVRS